MSLKTVKVVYVGKKQTKRDTVAGSNTVWFGHGDEQSVPADVAKRLLQYPDVWRLPGDVGKSVPQAPAGIQIQTEGSIHDEPRDPSPAEKAAAATVGEEDQPEDKADEKFDGTMSLAEALIAIDRSNPDHVSQHGKPKIAVVRKMTGNPDLSVEEVAEKWNELNG